MEQGAPEAQMYSPQTAPYVTAALSTVEQAPSFKVFFHSAANFSEHHSKAKKSEGSYGGGG